MDDHRHDHSSSEVFRGLRAVFLLLTPFWCTIGVQRVPQKEPLAGYSYWHELCWNRLQVTWTDPLLPLQRRKQKKTLPDPRLLLDGLDAAVLLLEADLRIGYLNAAAENLLRVSSSTALGQGFDHFCQSLAEESLSSLLGETQRTGTTLCRYALPLRVADGGRVVVDFLCNVLGAGEEQWIVELRPVESALRRVEEEMQDQIFAAAQEMLIGLAHEIKNPLGGLRGAAQLLERELPHPELQEYTQVILHEVDRLRRLVDRLRGDRTEPNVRWINIHEVLEHVRRLVQVNLPTGIALRRAEPGRTVFSVRLPLPSGRFS